MGDGGGILSIQSAVAYGHVGNSAAVFPLQRLGFEVWPVNTVLFSNHTGYGAWRGRVVDLPWVEEILLGIAERGALARTRAVLSGYLGDAGLGEVVLRAVAEVRGHRHDALYVCDPVMGDEGRGFFVRPGIPEFFKGRAVPAADIVTPNQFELAYLADMPIGAWRTRWRRRRRCARRAEGGGLHEPRLRRRGGGAGRAGRQRRGVVGGVDAQAAGEPERDRGRVHGDLPRALAGHRREARRDARGGGGGDVRAGRGDARGGVAGAGAGGGAGAAGQAGRRFEVRRVR
jgi:hypothetical protein